MIRSWRVVEADLRREYGLDAHAVRALTTREFGVCISGLSPDALFREAWRRTPRAVVNPGEIAAITGIPAT
ncbi:hypothetical protein [Streptomyces sp. SID3343]|uniref:hypothetical protein n=1 Tax=Streptomyces sp. SID3343 TaxID=2690260 RepID=UPI00136B1980|nr:hypothetical protein [Streptomyces sp. SID3343]MYW03460.1 hypothetical protein [Streptomyces sp. SID3343]